MTDQQRSVNEAAHTLCGQTLLVAVAHRSTSYAKAIRCICAQVIDRSIGSRDVAVFMQMGCLCNVVGHLLLYCITIAWRLIGGCDFGEGDGRQ